MSQVKLGDVAVESRETYKGDKSGMPIVGLEHITPGEVTLSNWDTDTDNTFTKQFRKGDMLFGRRRAYLKKAAQAPFDGICSGDITVIRAKKDLLLPELLPFIIQNDNLFDFAVGKSAGSLSPRVKWDNLKNYTFELPSIEEQKKLAEVLWSINDTLQAYQKLLAETDALVQAQFVEMFGTPDTNTHGYQIGIISDTVRDVHYGTSKKATDDGDYVYLRMNNITYDGNLDLSDIKRISVPEKELAGCLVKKGDVLFNRTNSRELVGKTCVFDIDEPMIIAGYIIRLRMNGLLCPEYLSTFLNLPSSKKLLFSMAKGAVGQANINAQEVQSIKIIIPPKDIQLQFCGIKARTDRAKSTLQNTITSLQATKRCILENALRTRRKE